MDFSKDYKDKVCVVTGAASGIGRSTAIALAKAGASLALSDVNEEGLAETLEMTGVQSNRIMTDRLDVGDAEQIAAYAPRVEAELGPADYVFNIAGLSRLGKFEHTPLESMEKVMDVNYWGVVRMCKAFLPQVLKTKGSLCNISSVFGIIGYAGQTHYCSSKFAVRGFSETLAQELKEQGVSVSCVHPGGVATNVARNAEVDFLPEGKDRDEMNAQFDEKARTTPEKAAEIILKGTAKRKRRILVGGDAWVIQIIQRFMPVKYPAFMTRVFGVDLN